jgi:hypothetical protein
MATDAAGLVADRLGIPREGLPEHGPIGFDDLGVPDRLRAVPWYQALYRIPAADAEFYQMILRRGGTLEEKPRVTVSTIHGAKGREADNVLLMTDVTGRSDVDSMQPGCWESDEEHRVFYVGVTRAKERLMLVEPQGDTGYRI